MKMDITKRIEWLSKRVNLTEQDKEYVRFVMVEVVTDAVNQVNKANDIHDISVSFADYLISDFEMVSEGIEGELMWQLCGTKQRYTSEEIYNVFINER